MSSTNSSNESDAPELLGEVDKSESSELLGEVDESESYEFEIAYLRASLNIAESHLAKLSKKTKKSKSKSPCLHTMELEVANLRTKLLIAELRAAKLHASDMTETQVADLNKQLTAAELDATYLSVHVDTTKSLEQSGATELLKKLTNKPYGLHHDLLVKLWAILPPNVFDELTTATSKIKEHHNILLETDSYKTTMAGMIAELGFEYVESYCEARSDAECDIIHLFGLQQVIQHIVDNPITQQDIDDAQQFVDEHVGPGVFYREGWQYILDTYQGKLPVVIDSVPEGIGVNKGNMLFRIRNNDPKCAFVVNHLETILLQIWYPSTIVSKGKILKDVFKKYLDLTSENGEEHIKFIMNDFGIRGTSSIQSSGIGGMAHLVIFQGSDNIIGITYASKFYYAPMAGYAPRATEHSLMISEGCKGEFNVIKKLLEMALRDFRGKMLSLVLDAYHIFKAVHHLTTVLLPLVKAIKGVVVIRPDSGKPLEVIPEILDTLTNNIGDEITINSKGFKILPSYIRIIWGDGLSDATIKAILEWLYQNGWSVENIVFGMGGGLLQKLNRDDLSFAFKCSAIYKDGVWRDVWKQPLHSNKSSKRGRLKLIFINGGYMTVRIDDTDYSQYPDLLETVFENGEFKKKLTFDEVRENTENRPSAKTGGV